MEGIIPHALFFIRQVLDKNFCFEYSVEKYRPPKVNLSMKNETERHDFAYKAKHGSLGDLMLSLFMETLTSDRTRRHAQSMSYGVI